MDFSYSEEQQLFSDSLRRLFSDAFPSDARRKLAEAGETLSPTLWAHYAELGLFGLPFAEADGGFGGSMSDILISCMEFGRALAVDPFAASAVVAGHVLAATEPSELRDMVLAGVIGGETRVAAAFLEPQSRYNLADVATCAEPDGDGSRLSGSKAVVPGGDHADQFIVSARVSGEQRDRDGLGLFLVSADASGVDVRGYPLADGRGAAEVELDNTLATGLQLAGRDVLALVEAASDRGAVAICGEAIGALEVINDLTQEYLRTREQFGRPIGTFQALQHRAVDMVLEYEHAKSLCFAASVACDGGDATARARMVSAAKTYIGTRGRKIATEAVQLHGGIGVTAEYDLGDAVKRVMVADMLYGDADHHLERFGAIAADPAAGGLAVWSA